MGFLLLNGIEKVRGSTPLISTTMKAHQAQQNQGSDAFLVLVCSHEKATGDNGQVITRWRGRTHTKHGRHAQPKNLPLAKVNVVLKR